MKPAVPAAGGYTRTTWRNRRAALGVRPATALTPFHRHRSVAAPQATPEQCLKFAGRCRRVWNGSIKTAVLKGSVPGRALGNDLKCRPDIQRLRPESTPAWFSLTEDAMRGFLGLCLLVGVAIALSVSQTLAQSGVFSGPPQVQPGSRLPGPDQGPGPGPGFQGPGPGPGGPFQGPGPGPGGPYQGPGPGFDGPRRQDDVWIAVVAGFDGSGKRVAVGYSGFQRSKFEAEDAAVRACVGNDRSVTCRNPFAVSTGCLYIVPGNRQGGGVRWGRGGTRETAIQECQRGGYNCPGNKMIGGCVPASR